MFDWLILFLSGLCFGNVFRVFFNSWKFWLLLNSDQPIELMMCNGYWFSDMRAFDELRKLEIFFKEETRRGCSVVELYELVQHAGNILPRLWVGNFVCYYFDGYLLAGSFWILNKNIRGIVQFCWVRQPFLGHSTMGAESVNVLKISSRLISFWVSFSSFYLNLLDGS